MDDSATLLLDPVGESLPALCFPTPVPVALASRASLAECLPAIPVPSSTGADDVDAPDTDVAGLLLRENLELRQQVGFWKSMHQRALARLAERDAEIEQLQAKLKLRERQLFGRKSEKGGTGADRQTAPDTGKGTGRRRGQQPDQPQPTRRHYDHLPVEDKVLDIAADEQHCPCCGLPWQAFPTTEDSEVIEIEVRPYRRRYRRRRYRPTCACGVQPGIITAPGPDKLLPKSRLGISIWVTVLLDKYAFARPTHRLLEDWRTHELDLSASTLAEGLQRLVPLLTPLLQALVLHQRQEKQWHADETRWSVFVVVDGKTGHRWYLWMFRSGTVVVFVLDPGRAHDVPEDHFGPDAQGILIVDRYAAYKAMAQVKAGQIVLAFCWAHQRRDFLSLAKDWPTLEVWAVTWLEAIGQLYHLNAQRLEVQQDPRAFAERDQALRQAMDAFGQRWQTELQQSELHPACQKVLTSLQEHWQGLSVFVDHPEVPMDNNAGERTIRDPAMGRKNYFGCGSLWSVQLAVSMFSLVATLRLWQINPRLWFTAYFEACAANAGQAPTQPERFLPWNLTADQRQAWQAGESDPSADTFPSLDAFNDST
jgi:transposase